MENVFTRSGAKAINLFRKHIFRTQLALSLFYFCISALILMISSQVTRTLFLHRIAPRFQERIEINELVIDSAVPRLKPNITEVQEDLRDIMLVVNVIFLVFAGILGYFLAGITLEPLKASYEKEQHFLSDASHELRTPLTILRTALENIRYKGSEIIKNDVQEAIEEVDRMNNLLQNILTLSRTENYTAQKESLSCKELLENTVKRLQPLAEKNACTLILEPITKDISLFGEKDALERALVNLTQNALTYNKPQGTVTLSLEKKRAHAIIRIEDTGIGMNAEEVSHLTERFYRAEKSRTRSKGGSGLGLAIVEQIVKNNKGTLTITSMPEKGTQVTMTFPIHKAS